MQVGNTAHGAAQLFCLVRQRLHAVASGTQHSFKITGTTQSHRACQGPSSTSAAHPIGYFLVAVPDYLHTAWFQDHGCPHTIPDTSPDIRAAEGLMPPVHFPQVGSHQLPRRPGLAVLKASNTQEDPWHLYRDMPVCSTLVGGHGRSGGRDGLGHVQVGHPRHQPLVLPKVRPHHRCQCVEAGHLGVAGRLQRSAQTRHLHMWAVQEKVHGNRDYETRASSERR